MSKSRIAGLVAVSMEDARANDTTGQTTDADAAAAAAAAAAATDPVPVIADPDTLEADVAVIGAFHHQIPPAAVVPRAVAERVRLPRRVGDPLRHVHNRWH